MAKGRRGTTPGEDLERALIGAAEAHTLDDLGEHVLPHLRHALGASSTLLYRYDEAGRIAPIAGELAASMEHYSREYFHLDPVHLFPRTLHPEPRVVHATRHVDVRAFRRSTAYGEFYATFELEHLVCAWLTHLPYGAPGMTGLLFARPRGHDDFARADQAFLGRVLPALAAAAARAARMGHLDVQREALEAIVSASARPARLVVSADGRIVWASPACEALLGSPVRAPLDELRRAALRIHEAARAKTSPRVAPSLSLVTSAGRLDAHLSTLRTPSGAPLVLVELEDTRAAPHLGDGLARRFGLTPAEETVLRVLADGSANRAIADRLHVSVETVRTHVRRILDKLGVRSRGEAAILVVRGDG